MSLGLGSRSEFYARYSHRDRLELAVLRSVAPWGADLLRYVVAHQTAVLVNTIRALAGYKGAAMTVADALLEFAVPERQELSDEVAHAAFSDFAKRHNQRLRLIEGGR